MVPVQGSEHSSSSKKLLFNSTLKAPFYTKADKIIKFIKYGNITNEKKIYRRV